MNEIAERVREAAAAGRQLRVRGAGTWMAAGHPSPVSHAATISVAEHRGIVDYVPGDLTLTARAGTTLSDIAAATAEHGQWLPLDPWGGDDGTLGATVSTATAGPHAAAMGLPRDVVLGLEFVTGTGDVVRAGGRVVKNVAGFDLARLVVGSWGTLGVVTEVSVRLRGRPEHARSLAIPVRAEADVNQLSELAERLRALPFAPLACEMVNAGLAATLGLERAPVVLVRLGGNAKSVDAQAARVAAVGHGDPRPLGEDVWMALRTAGGGTRASWRWSRLPSQFGGTWAEAIGATRNVPGALVHGSSGRGVVRVLVPAAAATAKMATAFTGTVVLESLPPDVWPATRTAGANQEIARALRAKFDPAGILNTGILVSR